MTAFTTYSRPAAVAVLAALLATIGMTPAMAETPKDLKVTLPTAPVLTTPVAVSGANILVQFGNTYRLSHDRGEHWVTARVPFPCSRSCSKAPNLTGSVASG